MRRPQVTTIHDATCGGCGSPAILAMAGEEFHHGRCRRCGLILMIEPDVYAELLRRVRSGLGRRPRRCWFLTIARCIRNFFSKEPT